MVVILRIASSRMVGFICLYADIRCTVPLFTNDADSFRFCIILGA